MKAGLSLLAAVLLAFLHSPALAEDVYRVFDKDGRVTEIWKEKDGLIEIYNPDWSRKGYIRKEGGRMERFDSEWRKEGEMERGPRWDKRGRPPER